jgi:mannose-1-phosphate guanylyltransferase
MPIDGKPLLEYWLDIARELGTANVLVNTHYLSDIVQSFLDRPCFKPWVHCVYEPELKGTAGTLRENAQALGIRLFCWFMPTTFASAISVLS